MNPKRFKDPKNYVRDTQNPHSGAASLRIFHPANTGGYIAANPLTNSFLTSRDTIYNLSFWAKSDTPGSAFLSVFGLKTLDTLVGETVLATKIDTTLQWKKFEFRLDECFDFSVASVSRLQLAFNATSYEAPNAERTLWIDDIEVTAQPAAFSPRSLLDAQNVPYAPVEHRLQPGSELNISVDAKKILRRATLEAEGVSFHRLQEYMRLPYDSAGEYKLAPEQETAIRELLLPHTRIYGLGDEPKFTLPQAIDNAAHLLERTGIAQDGSVWNWKTNTPSAPFRRSSGATRCAIRGKKATNSASGRFLMSLTFPTRAARRFSKRPKITSPMCVPSTQRFAPPKLAPGSGCKFTASPKDRAKT